MCPTFFFTFRDIEPKFNFQFYVFAMPIVFWNDGLNIMNNNAYSWLLIWKKLRFSSRFSK